ncbi:putative disease resistance RPP13-like protein 1 [Vitis vinifera]|uniref:putative disease resistance RPP13-like protein 1 n=1 Tax=Vitis vinifera TaxID=29760 RepID=UPI002882F48E|nr:putative disease resistance RPP13-like protein 1 [Vitis vinifera]
MAGASGWHVQATIWVVGGYARQLWVILASCITTILAPTFEFGNSNLLPISIDNLINLRHLDVAGAIKLQEMPIRIDKLKDLRILSNFIVDKNKGLTIKELKDVSHLRGELCISKLENVVNIQDARDADLKLKRNLESLIMQWSSELDGSGNERNQMDVLDSLQRCLNLNKLCIQLYGGPKFPRWIGDALFSKMVDLSLIDCRKCTSLPCLGQLPSLKQLRIQGMVGVKKVGAEFYGETRVSAGLKRLPDGMMLKMRNGSTDNNLCLLECLRIWKCPSLICFPKGQLPTTLKKLTIRDCQNLKSLPEGMMHCNSIATTSTMDMLPITLKALYISDCEKLESLPEGIMHYDSTYAAALQSLAICHCSSLTSFPRDKKAHPSYTARDL